MNRKRVAIALTTALSLVGLPALAEGTFQSYLYNVRVGYDSRLWFDSANPAGVTSIVLKYCDVNGNSGLFNSVQLGLFGPNGWHYSDVNYCDKSSFWVSQYGYYHFSIEKINGSTSSTPTLSSQLLVVTY